MSGKRPRPRRTPHRQGKRPTREPRICDGLKRHRGKGFSSITEVMRIDNLN